MTYLAVDEEGTGLGGSCLERGGTLTTNYITFLSSF